MKKHIATLAIATISTIFAGCVTSPTSAASRLKPITESDAKNCEFVSSFSGGEGGRGSIGRNTRGAFNKGLNDAAAAGADSYVLVSSTATGWGTSVIVYGYRCGS